MKFLSLVLAQVLDKWPELLARVADKVHTVLLHQHWKHHQSLNRHRMEGYTVVRQEELTKMELTSTGSAPGPVPGLGPGPAAVQKLDPGPGAGPPVVGVWPGMFRRLNLGTTATLTLLLGKALECKVRRIHIPSILPNHSDAFFSTSKIFESFIDSYEQMIHWKT